MSDHPRIYLQPECCARVTRWIADFDGMGECLGSQWEKYLEMADEIDRPHPVPEDSESAEVERLRKALEFYADATNYEISGGRSVLGTLSLHLGNVATDGGERARAALNTETDG